MGEVGLNHNNMDTPAVRNQNMGNLKDPSTGSFRSFSDPIDGKAALYNDLTSKMTGTSTTGINGGSSLLDFANTYAPKSDKNDPVQYAANLANKMGISPDTKIGTLMPRIDDFASAVASNEDPSAVYKSHTPIQGMTQEQPQEQSAYNPKPFSNPSGNPSGVGTVDYSGSSTPTPIKSDSQTSPSIGDIASGRITDASNAISDYASGKQGAVSTGLQVVGAVAGGAGDLVNKAVEATPVLGTAFKWIEKTIGSGINDFTKTDYGQSVVNQISDFAQQHPELSKDIGAGINIATAIPILKGFGVVKNAVLDAGSLALKNVAEKSMVSDLTNSLTPKIGKQALAKSPDAIKTLVQERAIPDIVDGKYNFDEAKKTLGDSISHIDNTEMQPLLEQVSQNQSIGQSLNTLKQLAIKEAENDVSIKEAGMVPRAIKQIEARFDGWEYSYGDTIKLDTQNRLKIGSGKFTEWGTPEGSADKAIYHALQSNIEDVAKKNGLADVEAINQKMSRLIKAQGIIPQLEGKKVSKGIISGLVRTGATAGGETVGRAFGAPPLVGGFIGYNAEKLGEKIAPKAIRQGILNRTAPDAIRQPIGKSIKTVSKGLLYNLANQQRQKKLQEPLTQ